MHQCDGQDRVLAVCSLVFYLAKAFSQNPTKMCEHWKDCHLVAAAAKPPIVQLVKLNDVLNHICGLAESGWAIERPRIAQRRDARDWNPLRHALCGIAHSACLCRFLFLF